MLKRFDDFGSATVSLINLLVVSKLKHSGSYRSSHRRCSKFHRKTPVLEPLFNKVAGLVNDYFFPYNGRITKGCFDRSLKP